MISHVINTSFHLIPFAACRSAKWQLNITLTGECSFNYDVYVNSYDISNDAFVCVLWIRVLTPTSILEKEVYINK